MNSLGINKSKKETKVVVAMSGGVDSSVVAALMKEEGYDVKGITLKLYDDTKQSKEGRQCCAGQDIMDAKRVSEKININHEILYYQKKFKDISKFVPEGVEGIVKFKGPVNKIIYNLTGGLRSSMGYLGAKTINDLQKRGEFVKISKAGFYESMVHNVDQVIK